MNKTELDKAVNFESKEIREKPNSNEFTNFYREICKSAYAVDDYPTYAGLEFTWKKIEKEFSLLKDDRENNKFDSPLSYFMYMVEGGFYPPPEVMLALLNCFENYYQHKGKKSEAIRASLINRYTRFSLQGIPPSFISFVMFR